MTTLYILHFWYSLNSTSFTSVSRLWSVAGCNFSECFLGSWVGRYFNKQYQSRIQLVGVWELVRCITHYKCAAELSSSINCSHLYDFIVALSGVKKEMWKPLCVFAVSASATVCNTIHYLFFFNKCNLYLYMLLSWAQHISDMLHMEPITAANFQMWYLLGQMRIWENIS